MAKKGLQPVDNDEDLEDSMSEDEVAAGAGGGASESEEEEEEQEWEPWLAPVISDETATPARVTFYGQGDGKVMQDGWERVKVVEIPNPFDLVHRRDNPSEQRSIRVTRNSKVLCAVSPGCAPYIALVRRIWKCPPEKEEPLPKDLKKGDPCVFNIKDFRMEVLWFYRINEAVAPAFLPKERRIAKTLLSGAKFGRTKEQGSERQLLFSSHSSLLDDKEHDNTDMEDSGIPLECVLSECTVYFLGEDEEQPRQAFLTPNGDYVERRAPGFVARYFLQYKLPYSCLPLGRVEWDDQDYHTHELAKKFLKETRAQLDKLEQANEAVRQEFRNLFPDKAAELAAKGWGVRAQQQQALQHMFASPKKPQKPPKQKQQQQQQQQKPAGVGSTQQPPKPPQQQQQRQGPSKQPAAAPIAAAAVPKPPPRPPSPQLGGMDEEEGSEQLLVAAPPTAVLQTPPRPLSAIPSPGSSGRGRSASLQVLSRTLPEMSKQVPMPLQQQQQQQAAVQQAGGQPTSQQQQQKQQQAAPAPRAGGMVVADDDSSEDDAPLIARRRPAGAGAAAGGGAAAAAATKQQQPAPMDVDLAGLLEDSE